MLKVQSSIIEKTKILESNKILLHQFNLLIFIFQIFIAVSFVNIAFRGTNKSEFLMIGDQFLRLTLDETYNNSFFIHKSENLGIPNSWIFVVQFWDVLYFMSAHLLGLPLRMIEQILFFSVILLSLTISFIGLKRLYVLFNGSISSISELLTIFVVSLWYVFNPYTLTIWHGGVYSLGFSFTYSLAPLIFVYFYRIVFIRGENIRTAVKLALIVSISSFVFWAFASVIFVLLVFFIFMTFMKPVVIKSLLAIRFWVFMIVFLLCSSFVIYNQLYEFTNLTGYGNPFDSPPFGNLQGGMWYQALMYFSWAIYTEWFPRTIYPFAKFFFTTEYIIATLSIYAIILIGLIKMLIKPFISKLFANFVSNVPIPTGKHKVHDVTWHGFSVSKSFIGFIQRLLNIKPGIITQIPSELSRIIIALVLVLIVCLFFAKASQPPFGGFFLFLYHNVPLFSVFRSTDARFGLSIVLSISFLLILLVKAFKPLILLLSLIFILLIQNAPFILGSALKGQNVSDRFVDRVVEIPAEYYEISRIINSDSEYFYTLIDPPVVHGQFSLLEHGIHIGQDLLAKLINNPLVYISTENTRLNENAETLLHNIKDSEDYSNLGVFPFKYILIRRDVKCGDCRGFNKEKLLEISKNIYSSQDFDLFLMNNYPGLSSNAIINFVNPTQYEVVSTGELLDFKLSYNKNWKLFSSPKIKLWDLEYLFLRPLDSSSYLSKDAYSNSWNVSPGTYVIFYYPQAWFKFFLLLSAFSFVLSLAYLFLGKRFFTLVRWYLVRKNAVG